jgi:RNA polymerase primary sigma factor
MFLGSVGRSAVLAGKVGFQVSQARVGTSSTNDLSPGSAAALAATTIAKPASRPTRRTGSKANSMARSELHQYIREINEYPLLTAEEEKELGWAIINDACQASRDRLIRSNLRLVVAIAKRFADRGVSLSDLIEEGNIGLMRACENFDPAQGARFSTYSSWWIKQAIKRALMAANQPVHIPAYMVELISKWKIAYRKLEAELGRSPSMNDLAGELNLPVRKIKMIRRAVKTFQNPSSSGSTDAAKLGEVLSDPRAAAPGDQMLASEELSVLKRLMDCISTREAKILRMRFGLDGSEVFTLAQISEALSISRERVRQIADEALTKLNQRLTSGSWPEAAEDEREAERAIKARVAAV